MTSLYFFGALRGWAKVMRWFLKEDLDGEATTGGIVEALVFGAFLASMFAPFWLPVLICEKMHRFVDDRRLLHRAFGISAAGDTRRDERIASLEKELGIGA